MRNPVWPFREGAGERDKLLRVASLIRLSLINIKRGYVKRDGESEQSRSISGAPARRARHFCVPARRNAGRRAIFRVGSSRELFRICMYVRTCAGKLGLCIGKDVIGWYRIGRLALKK